MPSAAASRKDVDRKMLGLVPLKRVGRKALVGEGLRHVANGEMVCGQGEHGWLSWLRSPRLARRVPDVRLGRNRAIRFPGAAKDQMSGRFIRNNGRRAPNISARLRKSPDRPLAKSAPGGIDFPAGAGH